MSYSPDIHPSQIKILRHLLFVPEASFSELKRQTKLDSDLFNFHLKKLVAAGFVEKTTEGYYRLTSTGKTFANRMDSDLHEFGDQAKLSVVIVVEDDQGRQLYQQRLKQPYYGFWGHPTTKVHHGETLLDAAERGLYDEAKLRANLTVLGVFHKLDYDQTSNELLEDKYLYLVHGTHPTGTLAPELEGHRNEWLSSAEVATKEKIFGSPEETDKLIQTGKQFVIEKKYHYLESSF